MYYKPDYDISVPLNNYHFQRMGREALVAQLKQMGVKRVFLTRNTYTMDKNKLASELALLKDNCAYLKSHGFSVGVWGWSFIMTETGDNYNCLTSLTGRIDPKERCPLDPGFREFVGEYMKALAQTGVEIILFDDDFRLGWWIGMTCACPGHLARMSQLLGEEVTLEGLKEKVLSGGKNPYRDALMSVNAEALTGFAKHVREAVDTVAPHVRMGLCANMSLWDIDGVDAATISRLLAGNTKPFLRLIGAAYWPTRCMSDISHPLGAVIEFSRMERSWFGDDIEVVGEGDPYPRPRYYVPSSYLELFDTALQADGGLDGIMKYAFDYLSNPTYETGYVEAHCRNRALYSQIREVFSKKSACGIRIYEKLNKFGDMVIPQDLADSYDAKKIFFSMAGKLTAASAIPSTYDGLGTCGIAFSENVKTVPEEALRHGLIIDAKAARLLEEQGIDTGIVRRGSKVHVTQEIYAQPEEYVAANYTAYVTEVSEQAQVLSWFSYMEDGTTKQAPASYYYENEAGHRYLVFTFDMYFNQESTYRNYMRAKQIQEAARYLSGQPLPAVIQGHPDLYVMTKKDAQGTMAVGLWNIFADAIHAPVITLDDNYRTIRFINCTGTLEGNLVTLSRLPAYEFAGFEVSK